MAIIPDGKKATPTPQNEPTQDSKTTCASFGDTSSENAVALRKVTEAFLLGKKLPDSSGDGILTGETKLWKRFSREKPEKRLPTLEEIALPFGLEMTKKRLSAVTSQPIGDRAKLAVDAMRTFLLDFHFIFLSAFDGKTGVAQNILFSHSNASMDFFISVINRLVPGASGICSRIFDAYAHCFDRTRFSQAIQIIDSELSPLVKSKEAPATAVFQCDDMVGIDNSTQKESSEERGRDESGDGSLKNPRIKIPSELELQIYRLDVGSGKTQQEIATIITAKTGNPCSQATVSRAIKKVTQFLAAGNVLPDLSPGREKPFAMDPAKIDLGERQKGKVREDYSPDIDG